MRKIILLVIERLITTILRSHQLEEMTLPVNIANIAVHHIVVHVIKTSKRHTTANQKKKQETLSSWLGQPQNNQ